MGLPKGVKRLPFELSRDERTSLTGQLVAAMRKAIVSGYYRPGDQLPPLRAAASELGVSMIVTRNALSRLVEEGLVHPRPGIGCVVQAGATTSWRGRVLFVVPDRGDSFHVTVAGDVLRRNLTRTGYLLSQITVPRLGARRYDLSQLHILLREPFSLVVHMFAVREIASCLAASGLRTLLVAREELDFPNCAVARFASDAAIPGFASHCARAGVRSVLQIGFEHGFADAAPVLRSRGIAVESVYADEGVDVQGAGVIEAVKRWTHAFFAARFDRGAPLPDLVYFADDHIAEAGLLALALRGVRVPADVKVVAWSNRGLAPVGGCPITRMEVDPFSTGEQLSKFALGLLAGSRPEPPVMRPEYLAGETF